MTPRWLRRHLLSLLVVGTSFVGFGAELRAQLVFNLSQGAELQALSGTNPDLYAKVLNGFNVAAQNWSGLLSDPVTVNIQINYAPLAPNVLGETSSELFVGSYSAFPGLLAEDQTSSYDNIAVSHLPAGPYLNIRTNDRDGTIILDNNQSTNNDLVFLTSANTKALVENRLELNYPDHDGAITFTSDFAWDFDRADGIQLGTYDFIGVATHEIGHALGFMSGIDDLDFFTGNGPGASIDLGGEPAGLGSLDPYGYFTILDLYRNSPLAPEGGYDWTTGGNPGFTIDGGATYLAPFSTGRFNGDGNQASHWQDNLFLGIMDPTVGFGEFLSLRAIDLQALDVIGWNLISMPQLITGSTTRDGLPYVITPGGTLTIDGTSASMQMLRGATTLGVSGLIVGESDQGSLSIASGSVFVADDASLGKNLGSTGTVTVTGTRSLLLLTGDLGIGGSGTLSGGTGNLTVTSSGGLAVGGTLKLWDQGTLTLSAGSAIMAHSFDRSLGTFNFIGGTLTVSGGVYTQAASTLTLSTASNPTLVLAGATTSGVQGVQLGVASGQSGTLAVLGGSTLSNTGNTLLGTVSGATGTATVSGSGSLWSNSGNFYVGGTSTGSGGTGILNVANGGTLTVGGTLKLWSNGTLNLSGGSINVGTFDASQGTFNFTGGTLQATNYAGTALNVDGGHLVNNGTADLAVYVSNGGVVSGSGTFTALSVGNGGTVSPGNSPETIDSGTTLWDTGGKYLWEINALAADGGLAGGGVDGGWDLVNTGTLTIGDPFTIEIHSLMDLTNDGALANWDAGYNYSWLIATNTNGAFLTLSGLVLDDSYFSAFNFLNSGYFTLNASLDGYELYLDFVTSAPEPTSLLLGSIAAVGLAAYRRKQARKTPQVSP